MKKIYITLNEYLERDKKHNITDDRINSEYFINRSGEIIKYEGDLNRTLSLHYEIGRSLFPEIKNPVNYLMNVGWVVIGHQHYNFPIIKKEPTEKQIETLKKLNLLDDLKISKGGKIIKYR